MTSVASTGRLSGFSQFEQFCTSVGSLLSSVWESTDSAFRRVHVMKRDADGNIKLYNKKITEQDPLTGETKTVTKKVAVLTYIEDVASGDMYLDEPNFVVVVKCALIALGIPFYTLGKMCWYVIKTPIEIGAIAIDTIVKIGQQIQLCKLFESANVMRGACIQISQAFGNGLFEIAKAPLFAFGCELAAIYGMFKPYHGRKFEAIIENAWQQGASYKEDLRNVPARPNEDCWTAFKKDIQDSHPFYLAHCFQVRGNVNESRVVVIRRDDL